MIQVCEKTMWTENLLGAVHKLRKAERGGRGGQEILTFPYEGEGGIWGMPYVRLHFLIYRVQFYPLFDNFLKFEAKIGNF